MPLGVSVDFLQFFAKVHQRRIGKRSTREVVNSIIIPDSRATSTSYLNFLICKRYAP